MTKIQQKMNTQISDSILLELFNSVGIGIISIDSNSSIQLANREAHRIFSCESENLVHSNIKKLIEPSHHQQFDDCMGLTERRKNNSYKNHFEFTGIRNDNDTFPVEFTFSYSALTENCTFTLIARDITEFKMAEEELKNQAYYDQLTQIPNRTLFEDRAETALNQAKRDNDGLAIIYIDLDGFKEINDTMGHGAGDVLLKALSQRFMKSARKADTVSRIGGDEFTILMPRITQIEDAAILAERILNSNKEPISYKDELIHPKTSIGISIYPQDGNTFETLLQNADKAMYRAKKSGKNKFIFYQSV